jgi:hypothetical protein
MHTLFDSYALTINGHEVGFGPNYPWQAVLETSASRSAGYKRSLAATSGWIEDSAGRIDRADIGQGHAPAMKKRKKLISGSRPFELCDGLHIPFFHQNRYLIPNTIVKLRLTRSSDKLCLLSTDAGDADDYKIILTQCTLVINEVQVNPSIINSQSTLMSVGNLAMYPMNHAETRMFTVSAGKLSDRIVIGTNQQVPKRVTIAFVDHEAKNGSLAKDPFRFQHFDIRRISLDLDGRPIPHKPIETYFPNGLVAKAYYHLAMATGRSDDDVDHGITMEQFKNGQTLFMFDLTPDGCQGSGVHLIKHGSLSLEVVFGTALPTTISVIIYTERDELLKFDKNRTLTKLARI